MKITGPYITKPEVVPEHVVNVLDIDAYWSLDYAGEPDEAGTFLYAKVAFPRLTDAQEWHRRDAEMRAAERAKRPKRSYRRRSKVSVTTTGSVEASPHDYEPGELTHGMHTDPRCRICGEPKH